MRRCQIAFTLALHERKLRQHRADPASVTPWQIFHVILDQAPAHPVFRRLGAEIRMQCLHVSAHLRIEFVFQLLPRFVNPVVMKQAQRRKAFL